MANANFEADFLGVGWRFPPTMRDGVLQLVDADDSIRESILLILRTAKGERVMRPDFGCGINDLVFDGNNSGTATLIQTVVEDALREFEKRINVTDVRVTPDDDQENRLNIAIDYLIRDTNQRENLVYPFYLEEV
jgi:hypothetical protein